MNTQKKTIFLALGLLFISSLTAQDKMKLYAFYTPSHKAMMDTWFLPSIQDDYEIIIKEFPQESPSATYLSNGWTRTVIHKVEMLIDAVQENWHKIFIYSDTDIQFLGKTKNIILKHMEGKDLVFQKDSPKGTLCTGFFACRGNEKTLKLWQDVKAFMQKTNKNGDVVGDQKSLNHCLRGCNNPYKISWDYLPKEFFGGGTFSGRGWLPGQKLTIPQNALMHHANFTKGIDNKIAQLKYVKHQIKIAQK
jgi:hypothetical protein